MLQYATVVRHALKDGIYCNGSVLRCDVFRSTTHFDEGLQENLNPRVDRRAQCLCELLNQQAAVGGHGCSKRVGDFEDTV